MTGSDTVTRGIRVSTEPTFLPERSDPSAGLWYFAYRIRITNHSAATVQLLGRHWQITDAGGRVEQVRGPGVVGEQPVLQPGESFEYTSFCPLPTPFGSMEGSYQMVSSTGERFEVRIAPFELSEPATVN